MRKSLLASIAAILFLVSCSVLDGGTGTATSTITPAISQPTNTLQPIATAIPTFGISNATIIPVVEQSYCPAQRDVQLSDLDIQQTSRLILRDRSEKLYLLGKDTNVVQEISLVQGALPSNLVAVSPNGQHLVYLAYKKNADSSGNLELWLKSLDGSDSQFLAEVSFPGPHPIWLNNGLIAVWSQSARWLFPTLEFIVNSDTKESTPLSTPFPELNIATFSEWPILT